LKGKGKKLQASTLQLSVSRGRIKRGKGSSCIHERWGEGKSIEINFSEGRNRCNGVKSWKRGERKKLRPGPWARLQCGGREKKEGGDQRPMGGDIGEGKERKKPAALDRRKKKKEESALPSEEKGGGGGRARGLPSLCPEEMERGKGSIFSESCRVEKGVLLPSSFFPGEEKKKKKTGTFQ